MSHQPAPVAGAVPEIDLPAEAPDRRLLHDAVHARPVTPLAAPSLLTSLAVLHDPADGAAGAERAAVLRALAPHGVGPDPFDPDFLHLVTAAFTARWERHGEFSVYALARPLPAQDLPAGPDDDLAPVLEGPSGWLHDAPGTTVTAVQVVVLRTHRPPAEIPAAERTDQARRLLGEGRLLGSWIRDTDAVVTTTYRLRPDGTTRMLLLVGPGVTEARIGRVVTALTELEIYRVLAMRAFPLARRVHTDLAGVEQRLADLTASIDRAETADEALLGDLLALAAQVQTTAATVDTRFSAALAYDGIVTARLADLRATSLPGHTGVFTYLERRLRPAMATVGSASRRLAEVGGHTTRAADLLRTRVGIRAETQNTALLQALEDGQRTQLRLQETVEGLSIAAISYYVVGLVGYLIKGLKGVGVPLDTDGVTAAAVPLVVLGVWFTLRRVRRRLDGGT